VIEEEILFGRRKEVKLDGFGIMIWRFGAFLAFGQLGWSQVPKP